MALADGRWVGSVGGIAAGEGSAGRARRSWGNEREAEERRQSEKGDLERWREREREALRVCGERGGGRTDRSPETLGTNNLIPFHIHIEFSKIQCSPTASA